MPAHFLTKASRHILDAISDGVYVTNEKREIVFWNQGAERITGYSQADVLGKHCHDGVLIHTDSEGRELCLAGCPLRDSIKNDCDCSLSEVFLKCKNGERLPVYVKTSSYEQDGKRYGVEIFGLLESVAGKDLAAQVQRLTDSSVSDPLTGLFNRRYVDVGLEQHFAFFRRMGQHYGVLYLDIDEFKSINDRFGHSVGDEVLVFVSRVITNSARRMDIIARYGGDEFVLICSVGTVQELEAAAERIVGLVRDSRFGPLEDSGLRLTVSIGAALVDEADSGPRDALDRADKAMYRAKRSGRNAAATEGVSS